MNAYICNDCVKWKSLSNGHSEFRDGFGIEASLPFSLSLSATSRQYFFSSKAISQKMNALTGLQLGLAYYDVAVLYISYNTMEALPATLGK